MFDIALRHLKDRISVPIAVLVPPWITPNTITFVAFISGLFSCYTAAFSSQRSVPILLWFLNRALDCLDGSVARRRSIASELGGFLDLLGDFIIYSLLPVSIAFGQDRQHHLHASIVEKSLSDWRAVAMLEASFHINNFVLFYIAAVASNRKANELTSVTMRPALIEGLESGLIFTAMLLWPNHINFWCWGMFAAVVVGIIQRVAALIPILRRLDRVDDTPRGSEYKTS